MIPALASSQIIKAVTLQKIGATHYYCAPIINFCCLSSIYVPCANMDSAVDLTVGFIVRFCTLPGTMNISYNGIGKSENITSVLTVNQKS